MFAPNCPPGPLEPERQITWRSVNRNDGEGVVSGVTGSWSGDEVWVNFASYVQAPSVYRYDYATDHLSPYHIPDVGLDPSEYVTEQVEYESRDGTRISMFVIHRAGALADAWPWIAARTGSGPDGA